MLNGTHLSMSLSFIGKIKLVIKILKCLDWPYFYFHTIYQVSHLVFSPEQYPILFVSKPYEVHLTLAIPMCILVLCCISVNLFSCGSVVKDIS